MDNSETIYSYTDVTPQLQEMIANQKEIIEKLEQQTAIQQEQINGFVTMINYQYATVGILTIASVVALLWNVLNKWFFRGV